MPRIDTGYSPVPKLLLRRGGGVIVKWLDVLINGIFFKRDFFKRELVEKSNFSNLYNIRNERVRCLLKQERKKLFPRVFCMKTLKYVDTHRRQFQPDNISSFRITSLPNYL